MGSALYSSKYIIIGHIISVFLQPLFTFLNFFRSSYKINDIDVNVILVNEYHRIGDVIIVSPILISLKKKYPKAQLILICNKRVKDFALHHNLADTIIGIDVPWTNWDWSIKKWWKALIFFSKTVKGKKIDLAFSFKGDLRDSFFLWLTNPKISFGYTFTGGKYFYTEPQQLKYNCHQRERAYKIIEKIGCSKISNLDINYNVNGEIVIHPGASDLRRTWPDLQWVKLIKLLSKKDKVFIVKTKQSETLLKILKSKKIHFKIFYGSLIDFSKWIKKQKLIISPDSMAGHLAAFHNIPSVTIFGSQDPKLTIPNSLKSRLVKPDKKCYHKPNHWRLCRKCISSVSAKKVYDEAISLLTDIKNQT